MSRARTDLEFHRQKLLQRAANAIEKSAVEYPADLSFLARASVLLKRNLQNAEVGYFRFATRGYEFFFGISNDEHDESGLLFKDKTGSEFVLLIKDNSITLTSLKLNSALKKEASIIPNSDASKALDGTLEPGSQPLIIDEIIKLENLQEQQRDAELRDSFPLYAPSNSVRHPVRRSISFYDESMPRTPYRAAAYNSPEPSPIAPRKLADEFETPQVTPEETQSNEFDENEFDEDAKFIARFIAENPDAWVEAQRDMEIFPGVNSVYEEKAPSSSPKIPESKEGIWSRLSAGKPAHPRSYDHDR